MSETRLLADIAEATVLVAAVDEAAGGRRGSPHTPGRALAELEMMLADVGEEIADLAGQRNPAGPVRTGGVPGHVLAGAGQRRRRHRRGIEAGAAVASERAWLLRAESRRPLPEMRCAGRI